MLGQTEMRTRDRIYCQTMRTVRDISRDDRARIATCILRTPTDRLKENYSIDESTIIIVTGYSCPPPAVGLTKVILSLKHKK